MALAGISARQLQWWVEHGIARCHIEKHARVFEFLEVLRLMVIADLARRQTKFNAIRGMRGNLSRQLKKALLQPGTCYWASDRKIGHLIHEQDAVKTIAQLSGGAFLVPVSEYIRKLENYTPAPRRRRIIDYVHIPRVRYDRLVHDQARLQHILQ